MEKFEKDIVARLKFLLDNRSLKIDDVMEWSTSKDEVQKNIQPEKEIFVEVASLGVYCAVLKSADKRN